MKRQSIKTRFQISPSALKYAVEFELKAASAQLNICPTSNRGKKKYADKIDRMPFSNFEPVLLSGEITAHTHVYAPSVTVQGSVSEQQPRCFDLLCASVHVDISSLPSLDSISHSICHLEPVAYYQQGYLLLNRVAEEGDENLYSSIHYYCSESSRALKHIHTHTPVWVTLLKYGAILMQNLPAESLHPWVRLSRHIPQHNECQVAENSCFSCVINHVLPLDFASWSHMLSVCVSDAGRACVCVCVCHLFMWTTVASLH